MTYTHQAVIESSCARCASSLTEVCRWNSPPGRIVSSPQVGSRQATAFTEFVLVRQLPAQYKASLAEVVRRRMYAQVGPRTWLLPPSFLDRAVCVRLTTPAIRAFALLICALWCVI